MYDTNIEYYRQGPFANWRCENLQPEIYTDSWFLKQDNIKQYDSLDFM